MGWETVRWGGYFVVHAESGQADPLITDFGSANAAGRSPCGPTTPILPFPRVFPFPPAVRRRSSPFFTFAQSRRTVIPSVAATPYRLRLALRQVAHSVQSDRLLHRALSHRRCDSASIDGFPRIRSHRRLRRVDVAVSSRRDRNRRLRAPRAEGGTQRRQRKGRRFCMTERG